MFKFVASLTRYLFRLLIIMAENYSNQTMHLYRLVQIWKFHYNNFPKEFIRLRLTATKEEVLKKLYFNNNIIQQKIPRLAPASRGIFYAIT